MHSVAVALTTNSTFQIMPRMPRLHRRLTVLDFATTLATACPVERSDHADACAVRQPTWQVSKEATSR